MVKSTVSFIGFGRKYMLQLKNPILCQLFEMTANTGEENQSEMGKGGRVQSRVRG